MTNLSTKHINLKPNDYWALNKLGLLDKTFSHSSFLGSTDIVFEEKGAVIYWIDPRYTIFNSASEVRIKLIDFSEHKTIEEIAEDILERIPFDEDSVYISSMIDLDNIEKAKEEAPKIMIEKLLYVYKGFKKVLYSNAERFILDLEETNV